MLNFYKKLISIYFNTPILLLTIVCLYTTTLYAQSKKYEKKLHKSANKDLIEQKYTSALKKFKELYLIDSNNIKYNIGMGISYLYGPYNKLNSIKYFEFATGINNPPQHSYFYLALAYHYANRFDEAIKFYTINKNLLKNNKANYDIKKYIDRQIEMCNNAKTLTLNPSLSGVKNIGDAINTIYSEYAPVIKTDESFLIFTSRRPKNVGNLKDFQDNYFEDIYISNNDNRWDIAYKLDSLSKNNSKSIHDSTIINNIYHDAAVALSPDGTKLYVYKTKTADKEGSFYVYYLSGDKWVNPEKIGDPINSKYWEGSLSISNNGKEMYFSSDRPGGIGGKDIYKVRKLITGEWGKPENLGSSVNTPFDEDSPFIHPDNKTLFFSSTGHNSMGGYDIFRSHFDSISKWSKAENIGYPINSTYDDIYFVLNANGEFGYFSSNRDGGYGDMDIYVAIMPEEYYLKPQLTVMSGIISACSNPIEATITVEDANTNQIQGIYRSNSITGKYLLILPAGKSYNIQVESTGYLFTSDNIFFPIFKDTFVQISKNIDLLCGYLSDNIVLKNVEFEKQSIKLSASSYKTLDNLHKFLSVNDKIKLKIDAYVSSSILSEELALKRAMVINDYLVKKGLTQDRISANGNALDDAIGNIELHDKIVIGFSGGHLEKQNLSSKENTNQLKDPVYLDILNAFGKFELKGLIYRVQIGAYHDAQKVDFSYLTSKEWLWYMKIQKEIGSDGVTKFTVGEFKKIEDADVLKKNIIHEGVVDAWVVAYYNGKRISNIDLKQLLIKVENKDKN